MRTITLPEIWAWLLGACAAIVTISRAYEVIKRGGRGAIMEKLEKDKRRLDAHEEEIKELRDTNRVLLRALLAMVNHEIDGNGIDGLKRTRTELTDYLTKN